MSEGKKGGIGQQGDPPLDLPWCHPHKQEADYWEWSGEGTEVTPFLCLPENPRPIPEQEARERKRPGSFTVGPLESHSLNLCTCERKNRGMCVSFNSSCGQSEPCVHFLPLFPPSFHRHLAALGAMTHWPSKKHSSTHPEVVPAKSSSRSSPHNSSLFWEAAEVTVWGFFPPSHTAESPEHSLIRLYILFYLTGTMLGNQQ